MNQFDMQRNGFVVSLWRKVDEKFAGVQLYLGLRQKNRSKPGALTDLTL